MFNQSRGSVFSYRSLVAVVSLLILSPLQAFAAAPSAGDILRQQPQPPAVVVPETTPAPPPAPAEKEKEAGPKILVKGFRIKGAHLIPEAELAAQLQGAIGKELSFRQLRAVTSILVAYYAQKGYLARVILPEQDIKDGIVTLQVVEGRRGSLRINSFGKRIDSARVERLIDQRLGKGDAMNIADLGEALNILNEQPGILSNSSLVPGKGQGDVDVVVTALDKPLFGAAIGVNNYGMKSTGQLQESGSVTLSNPTGHFDAASLTANVSDGTTLAAWITASPRGIPGSGWEPTHPISAIASPNPASRRSAPPAEPTPSD
ncbi:MAG: POTRA domain-containing protein [Burkholderiales bacterium]